MARVKRPRPPIRVPKAMDADQCRRLLEAATTSRAKERDTLMLLMGLTMGLRLVEITSARPDDFYPSTGEPTHLRGFPERCAVRSEERYSGLPCGSEPVGTTQVANTLRDR